MSFSILLSFLLKNVQILDEEVTSKSLLRTKGLIVQFVRLRC